MSPPERWHETVGLTPFLVWVGEREDKDDVVYLRWRIKRAEGGKNWKWESLGVKARTAKGRLDKAVVARCMERAFQRYEILSGKRASIIERGAPTLTLGTTWPLLIDKQRGKYPVDTPHRREVARALATASKIWGPETPWATIDKSRLRELARTAADELHARKFAGLRGAEIVVQRVLAVATWLRDEGHIPADAAHPRSKWRAELREYIEQQRGQVPEPSQPSYSVEEYRTILEMAWQVDPRCGLAAALGAEQRMGQVIRGMRADLDVTARTFRIRGRGKKGGGVVHLTDGQMQAVERALTGYLRPLEAFGGNYPLFPAGQLTGGRKGTPVTDPARHVKAKSITATALHKWLERAEEKAEIPHVPGRAWYGLKRQGVSSAKEAKISREGLKAWGTWSDTQMPDKIYADQEAVYAGHEARDVRARVRGEAPAPQPEQPTHAPDAVPEEPS